MEQLEGTEGRINRIENNHDVINNYRDKATNIDAKQKKDLMASIAWLFLTDNIKKNTREKIQKDLKRNDTITMVLAFLGVITNVISSTIYVNFETTRGNIIII
jgi:hypothetical protein